MKIKLFSDMVCPYCYVGKLRLNQAIERLELTDVEVDADILEAKKYGIHSIPFFIFEDHLAVSGAQPVEVFMHALQETQKLLVK